jgi:hypothetical protein
VKETILKPGHRWKDNIKMGLQDIGLGGLDWIDLAQDRERSVGQSVSYLVCVKHTVI